MNRNLLKTFLKAYPIIYKPVWRENLLLSFVDIFHGLSGGYTCSLSGRMCSMAQQMSSGLWSAGTILWQASW